MSQRFEHCHLAGSRITYLGRDGLFEDKKDRTLSEYAAWYYIYKNVWELVSVIVYQEGKTVSYFKRPFTKF